MSSVVYAAASSMHDRRRRFVPVANAQGAIAEETLHVSGQVDPPPDSPGDIEGWVATSMHVQSCAVGKEENMFLPRVPFSWDSTIRDTDH